MVKSVCVVTRVSEKKQTVYSCIEFDLGYRKLKFFADNYTYQSLLNMTPKEFSEMLVDSPMEVCVKGLFLEKQKSAKTGSDYYTLVVDVGYRKINLFGDRFEYCDIANITPKEYFNIQLGQPFVIKVGV